MSSHSHNVAQQPELELEHNRSAELGYESAADVGFVRCLAHGFPTPLARWHYHDDYELHLITSTSGKLFVGDWIGPFQAGQLVLTGPRLPHNWVSMNLPEGGVAQRDLVIQFLHEPLARASENIAELAEVLPLLERAKHGIEFFGMSASAQAHWHKIKGARGLKRFTAFCDFLGDLAACTDYRLLSNVQLQSTDDDAELAKINALVNHITAHLSDDLCAATLAAEMSMNASGFSRFFRKATGNTFTDFVNRVRVSRACQLLADSERPITQICYEVGFNNIANFNRRFLEVKRVTPSKFRKQSHTALRNARNSA